MTTTHLVKLSIILSGFMLCLATPVLAAGIGTPHWSYEGEEGPDHWVNLRLNT